jgi:hypothetical protein
MRDANPPAMPDPDALTIRPSGLHSAAGGTVEDDYVIKWRGIEIGRIYKAPPGMVSAERMAKGDVWFWFLSVFPAGASHQGQADTLEGAKVAFKAALDKVPAERRIPAGYSAGHERWKREHGDKGDRTDASGWGDLRGCRRGNRPAR